MKTLNKQKLLDLVVKICNEYPAAANNDAKLLEQVWLAQGWSEYRSLYENLCSVSRPESITRRRREAHTMGLIEYSSEVVEERMQAFKNEQNGHSNHELIEWFK